MPGRRNKGMLIHCFIQRTPVKKKKKMKEEDEVIFLFEKGVMESCLPPTSPCYKIHQSPAGSKSKYHDLASDAPGLQPGHPHFIALEP